MSTAAPLPPLSQLLPGRSKLVKLAQKLRPSRSDGPGEGAAAAATPTTTGAAALQAYCEGHGADVEWTASLVASMEEAATAGDADRVRDVLLLAAEWAARRALETGAPTG